jgi:hypothetical protein
MEKSNKYVSDVQLASVDNLKRVRIYANDFDLHEEQGIQFITDFQELKTTWHPIEKIGGASSSY